MAASEESPIAMAKAVAVRLLAAGAKECMFVGGYVRDRLLGLESKDIDIEVYGLEYDQIVELLAPDYDVDLVGRSFGVVKVNQWLDVSVPRVDSRPGIDGRDVSAAGATVDPYQASSRRDFTINSMGMRLDGTLFDPHGGRMDLERKILRATSAAFADDPLRVLRGMQFAARFGFEMDGPTISVCRQLAAEYARLARERVWEEWQKWATKGRSPSQGLKIVEQTGWIAHYPILGQMRDTQQDPSWHPEGDVLTHTAHVCDAAVEIADREGFDDRQRAILVFAALCHDFGKVRTTGRNDQGRLVSPAHAHEGVEPARGFLESIRAPGWLIEQVLPVVAEHMVHIDQPEDGPPSLRIVRRLANRLAPASIRMWSAICEADASGRPPHPKRNPVASWVGIAQRLAIDAAKPKPLLLGRHLLPVGYPPGPELGRILGAAFEAQLDGEFSRVEEGIQWVRKHHPAVNARRGAGGNQ